MQSVALGVDLNILVGLPPDFTFQPQIESPAAASVYATPKPPAKASARWLRSYGRWRTNWSLVPVWQPCGQSEHRVKDLPADEPTFLSYQLPWEFTESRRFYHRVSASDMKKARKTEGRLADPSYFPWELRRVCSPPRSPRAKSTCWKWSPCCPSSSPTRPWMVNQTLCVLQKVSVSTKRIPQNPVASPR